jgi:chromosomal replication initiator protein
MQNSVDTSLFFVPLSGASHYGIPDDAAAYQDRGCDPFYVGDSANKPLRILADMCLLEAPFWPLVLCGPPLTGKTVLAESVSHRYCASADCQAAVRPKALYLTAVDLGRQLADAVQTSSMADYRSRLLKAGALAIDDVHKLSGNLFAQSQLVLLLDQFLQQDIPVVITMNQSPQSCIGMTDQLVSRLMGGLVFTVGNPGPIARRQLLNSYANRLGLKLAPDAIDWLVTQGSLTVPAIRSLLQRLAGLDRCQSNGIIVPLDVHAIEALMVADELSGDLDELQQLIVRVVAESFQLPAESLISGNRRQSTVLARGAAIYVFRTFLKLSFVRIGKFFGGRDHSTMMHAFKKISMLIESDSCFSRRLSSLQPVLHQQFSLLSHNPLGLWKSCSLIVDEC